MAVTVVGFRGENGIETDFVPETSRLWIGRASGKICSVRRFFLRKFGKQLTKISKNNENLDAL
jgi:hypothetical protein